MVAAARKAMDGSKNSLIDGSGSEEGGDGVAGDDGSVGINILSAMVCA